MPKTLNLQEFIKRLRAFGVIPHPDQARGKGSEIIVYRPSSGSHKGLKFPLTNHGMGRDVLLDQLLACLRRFGISKKEFFNKRSLH